jgi:hypothetical protein
MGKDGIDLCEQLIAIQRGHICRRRGSKGIALAKNQACEYASRSGGPVHPASLIVIVRSSPTNLGVPLQESVPS